MNHTRRQTIHQKKQFYSDMFQFDQDDFMVSLGLRLVLYARVSVREREFEQIGRFGAHSSC